VGSVGGVGTLNATVEAAGIGGIVVGAAITNTDVGLADDVPNAGANPNGVGNIAVNASIASPDSVSIIGDNSVTIGASADVAAPTGVINDNGYGG